ncbi:MAG: MATE family efflux transporter [Firmicutes bacterium]|nr:MATE family efflux transporter [Bacillota bacterium]
MDLTDGSVSKRLLFFSLPFLLSSVAQALYSLADMLIVGRFHVAGGFIAVYTGGQITIIVTNFVMGFALGGTVLIAQYVGAKRDAELHEIVGTLFTSIMIAAVALTALGIAFARPLILLIGTPAEAVDATVRYVVICMAGNIFVFGFNAISAVMRGLGDSVRPLIIVSAACVLSAGLDLLLVGACGLGVDGAAYSTVFAQGLCMFAAVFYLYKSKFVFGFKFKSFRIHKEKLRALIKIGFPTSLQNIIASVSFLVLIALLNRLGAAANGGAGICTKINSIAILPAVSMGMAVASMVGQNIGAREYARAKRTALLGACYSMIVGIFVFAAVSVFPRFLIGMFDPAPKEAEMALSYLKTFRWDYLIVPLLFALMGLVNGSGHTFVTMVCLVSCSLLFRWTFALWFGFGLGLGVAGIGLAVPATSVCALLILSVYTATGRWKKSTVFQKSGQRIKETVKL